MQDYKNMSDRGLIQIINNASTTENEKNLVVTEFIRRYDSQINKNWWVLSRQFGGKEIVNNYREEYYSSAYEAIYTAINKINLEKIEDDNWKLLQYSSFYIRNARNKIAKKIIKQFKVRPLDNLSYINDDPTKDNKADPEVEKAYEENVGYKYNPETIVVEKEVNRIKWDITLKHYENWDDTYKRAFNLLKEGNTKKETARLMGISSNALVRILRNMRKELQKDFIKVGIA